MSSLVRQVLIGVGVVLVQWLVLERLGIYGATPDAVLIYVLWTSLNYGRQTGSLVGFGAGFLADLLYAPWLGLNMFLKTLVGFFGSFFPTTQRQLLVIHPLQAFIGTLIVALLHDGLKVLFIALATGSHSLLLITGTWLGSAFYTAALAFLVALFYNR